MAIKLAIQGIGACLALGLASPAFASDFGCQALLCFAGGKNVSECQPTIKRVLKDLAKGKGFPHCSLVGGQSSSGQSITDAVKVSRYTEKQKSPICKDGETRGRRIIGSSYYCPTIEINISPEYAVDEKHQKQIFNYQL